MCAGEMYDTLLILGNLVSAFISYILGELEMWLVWYYSPPYSLVISHFDSNCYVHSLTIAKKSLQEIRQVYFKLRNRVFAKTRMGVSFDTQQLEELLQQTFGTKMTMSDVTHPKWGID